MKGFGNVLKQAQEMQAKIMQVQKEMEKKEVEASAGGEMVTVKVNGDQKIIDIKIQKEIIESQDIEMLQDILISATNEALSKSKQMVQDEMSKITGGLNLPF